MSESDPTTFGHEPVMASQIVALFESAPPGVVVDATLGGGGHSAALLEAHSDLTILGLDHDDMALAAATNRLASHGDRVRLQRARFDDLAVVAAGLGVEQISGFLFDLGVSSPQLDRPERGFSYRTDGPLDMRMDRRGPRSAHDVVNTYAIADLTRVLRTHGDERHAARIARAIVAARPVSTTGELAEIVRSAIPAPARRSGGHPAKRSFQAIRIEVNEELAVLQRGLDQALALLAPYGRGAVLSYHSGEDRIVKRCFRDAAGEAPPPRPGLPPPPGTTATVRLLWRGTRKPSAEETALNPRAASARLRAVERLGDRL